MSRNSSSSFGAFHPIMFFMVVYGMSLFLAIFVCRMVYFSINKEQRETVEAPASKDSKLQASLYPVAAMNTTVLK
jgi:hypothetical protein